MQVHLLKEPRNCSNCCPCPYSHRPLTSLDMVSGFLSTH